MLSIRALLQVMKQSTTYYVTPTVFIFVLTSCTESREMTQKYGLTFKDDSGDRIRDAECLFRDCFSALDHHLQHGVHSRVNTIRCSYSYGSGVKEEAHDTSRLRKERREQCSEARLHMRLGKNTTARTNIHPLSMNLTEVTRRPVIHRQCDDDTGE